MAPVFFIVGPCSLSLVLRGRGYVAEAFGATLSLRGGWGAAHKVPISSTTPPGNIKGSRQHWGGWHGGAQGSWHGGGQDRRQGAHFLNSSTWENFQPRRSIEWNQALGKSFDQSVILSKQNEFNFNFYFKKNRMNLIELIKLYDLTRNLCRYL